MVSDRTRSHRWNVLDLALTRWCKWGMSDSLHAKLLKAHYGRMIGRMVNMQAPQ